MTQVSASLQLVLVLDNASYHHSAVVEVALACLKDASLFAYWLPSYCSNLNLIKRFSAYLKTFASVSALRDSVRRCLQNQHDLLASDRLLFLNT